MSIWNAFARPLWNRNSRKHICGAKSQLLSRLDFFRGYFIMCQASHDRQLESQLRNIRNHSLMERWHPHAHGLLWYMTKNGGRTLLLNSSFGISSPFPQGMFYQTYPLGNACRDKMKRRTDLRKGTRASRMRWEMKGREGKEIGEGLGEGERQCECTGWRQL